MKAISPVIATVIIVSVAIAISIAVALWLTGITSGFTGLEKLEVVSGYAEKDENNNFTVYLTVKNTGTGDATLNEIFINGRPIKAYVDDGDIDWLYIKVGTNTNNYTTSDQISDFNSNGVLIPTGQSAEIQIHISKGFSSGQTIEVRLHTAAGKDYPKSITLP